MGKYDKFKKLILPLNVVKNTITTSLPGLTGQLTTAGPGNEGIDLAEWFQERLDDGTIIITSPDITDLITLTGLPSGSINLGTFTGSIISNNTTIVNALQELETYIESIIPGGINIGSGLVGDGTPGDPLDWAGGFSSSPITGSGTTFFPFTIANNSITTNHIQNGTILFTDWAQNSATSGQVPSWNGSAWIATSISGSLPAGSLGDILVHNGTTFVPASNITETQTGITGTILTLASTPLSYTQLLLFRNGAYQVITDDYTRSGTTVTFVTTLVSTDKITIIYYI